MEGSPGMVTGVRRPLPSPMMCGGGVWFCWCGARILSAQAMVSCQFCGGVVVAPSSQANLLFGCHNGCGVAGRCCGVWTEAHSLVHGSIARWLCPECAPVRGTSACRCIGCITRRLTGGSTGAGQALCNNGCGCAECAYSSLPAAADASTPAAAPAAAKAAPAATKPIAKPRGRVGTFLVAAKAAPVATKAMPKPRRERSRSRDAAPRPGT